MKFSRRLKRIVIVCRCLIRATLKGSVDVVPKNISRIILVPSGKLGDVVCTTPVLRALRERLPAAYIIIAGNSKFHRALLSDSGLVDEYLDLEEAGSIARIKKSRVDAAFVTGPSFEPAAKLFIAGVPLVVAPRIVGGFSPSETRPYKILQRFIKTFPYHIEAYAPRERLRVLESIGIFSDDTKKHLGFSEEAQKKTGQFLMDNGIDIEKDLVVGMSPSAGNKIKEWPEERFAKVADHLATKYQAKIIMVGTPSDESRIKNTIGHMRSDIQVLKITDFNIDMLKALVAKLSLFISVDTGPIYIAEAFNVPTVDIVGPVDEHVQPPRGPMHRSVVPPGRLRAELSILNARSYNTEEAVRQVLSISADAVLKEVDGLMHDIHKL